MQSRTKSSIKNTIGSIASNIVTILINFVVQAIFLKILGVEYSGINGLFSNILTMLGIVEMGLGNAIIFNLYKPIANNDKEKIKSLMQFYKKSYHIIAVIVSVIGVSLIPALPYIVGTVKADINLNIVYLLFLFDTVAGYLLSYKRSILYANQENYIVNIIHIGYLLIMNISQLIILYFTKNYYLYLGVKIIMRIVENLVITAVANKKYKYLKEKEIQELSKETKADIFKKIKAMFLHKIGGFVVNGSDNIIISSFLGVSAVGMYYNYYIIINAVYTLFTQLITSTTASVGNLLASNDEKKFEVFKKIRFFNFWTVSFSGICILVIMNSFINVWIGSEYILPNVVLYVLVFNYYQKSMRNCYIAFKDAAGIYYEDRYVPILESIINIVTSIILLKIFGLVGVFLGTVFSGFVLHFYSYPKFVYKKIFDRTYKQYMKETIGYIFTFIIVAFITYCLSNIFRFDNGYIEVIKNVIVAVIIPNIIFLILFKNTEEYKYYKELILKILRSIGAKEKSE